MDDRILTPDQRLRVFISSTIQELAPERAAVRDAISALQMTPVLFELGARPHPPAELYRSYLEQSHVFVGVYWESYGWIAPGEDRSGIDDEYVRSAGKPRLVYVKEPAAGREPQLEEFLDRLRAEGAVSYKPFADAAELGELVSRDLALLVSERFEAADEAASRLRGLPAQATSFVGRAGELERIAALLRTGEARLLTLTGPGGIGKTRLAIEAATLAGELFPDGIAFVALEGLESAELVPSSIATALGLRDVGPDPVARVAARLAGRRTLLVLDNFEHVIDAAPVPTKLLAAAPGLAVLVTSRELLRVRGERELQVQPLSPEADAAVLFTERAAAARGELGPDEAPFVTEICRRLDGVPLAIELAAPGLRLLSPEQLLARLSERVTLAGPRDAPTRQRTLEAAIAWSYNLLEPEEKRLFARLGVFRGSFTIEAASAVGELAEALDLVASLLDKSLVYRLPIEGETRFAMLSLIRDFAQARLEDAGELGAALDALTGYYVGLAGRLEQALRSTEQQAAKREIDLEADTLRVVLGALVKHGRGDELVTLLRGVWLWFWLTGQLEEGRSWVQQALPFADELDTDQRAWLYCLDGQFAFFQLDHERAAQSLGRARELFEQAGDRLGIGTAILTGAFATAAVQGQDAALRTLGEALAIFIELEDEWSAAVALTCVCRIRSIFGSYEGGPDDFERSLQASERFGDDVVIGLSLANAADYFQSVGDAERARALVDRALELFRTTGIRYPAPDVLETLARLERDAGDSDRAAELVGAAETLREQMRTPLWGPIAARHERFLGELTASLGNAAFEAARDRGRRLPLEQLVA